MQWLKELNPCFQQGFETRRKCKSKKSARKSKGLKCDQERVRRKGEREREERRSGGRRLLHSCRQTNLTHCLYTSTAGKECDMDKEEGGRMEGGRGKGKGKGNRRKETWGREGKEKEILAKRMWWKKRNGGKEKLWEVERTERKGENWKEEKMEVNISTEFILTARMNQTISRGSSLLKGFRRLPSCFLSKAAQSTCVARCPGN